MALTFDAAKRDWTLAARGLDFADAEEVLEGPKYQFADEREDYGEVRITTVGFLHGRMVLIVWTERGDDRHVISMRKANEREQRRYRDRMA
jgi:uncharacterized DUF497 family protein